MPMARWWKGITQVTAPGGSRKYHVDVRFFRDTLHQLLTGATGMQAR